MKPIALFMSDDNGYKMQFEENGTALFCRVRVKDDSAELEETCVSDDADKELVLACVEAFHRSRRTLFQDSEPMVSVVNNNPVISTKKKLIPKRIEAGERLCDFRADIECDGKTSIYNFVVNDHGFMLGTEWDDNFWRDIGGELHTAGPLFKAITDFYKLRCSK